MIEAVTCELIKIHIFIFQNKIVLFECVHSIMFQTLYMEIK